MSKIVLIDGNAIIHRAYHSIPKNLKTRSGEQTNAVYGFATTLIKVLEDLKPQYVACSFDLAGPTFRHEAYGDYKATRVKADQELYDQIPRVRELIETMGIPIYEKQGYEADDCLGTITQQILKTTSTDSIHLPAGRHGRKDTEKVIARSKTTKQSGIQAMKQWNNETMIFIVSGDKDIFQLVDGNVKVYNLKKGLSQTQIVDSDVIQKEYNLQPSDFIDLKALAGDSSDNIPGVPGIGPKTATDLIQKFDTLKNLYQIFETEELKNLRTEEQIEKISEKYQLKPRIVKLLIENKEQAFMSQKLATIHKDVPIKFSLDDAKWGEYDRDKLRKLFEEFGFQSLLRRFGASSQTEEPMNLRTEEPKATEEQKKEDKQLRLL